MNRSNYFDTIEEKINLLALRIISRGRLNLLNLNLHSENFYYHFLNLLFGWKSSNANPLIGNAEGIDLIDHDNRLIIQVSSTSTRNKIESSLAKDIIRRYSSYTFKFVSIARDSDNLRSMSFANPHGCNFSPTSDIIDKHSILKFISELETGRQQEICKFIIDELGSPIEVLKLETTIAELINFLYEHKPTKSKLDVAILPFEIDRKISHNNLKYSIKLIEEHSIYSPDISDKYSAFDKEGINKSRSVIQTISRFYIDLAMAGKSPDEIFFGIVDMVADYATESGNFVQASKELVQLSSEILTVDTFLRCKIFEIPPSHVAAK